jgi:hypothetical protein
MPAPSENFAYAYSLQGSSPDALDLVNQLAGTNITVTGPDSGTVNNGDPITGTINGNSAGDGYEFIAQANVVDGGTTVSGIIVYYQFSHPPTFYFLTDGVISNNDLVVTPTS